MLERIDSFLRRPRLLVILSTLALLLYNNWLLGPFFNHQLFKHNGSVSEFSAMNQPHFWLFRGLDIAAGILLLFLAYALALRLAKRGRAAWSLVAGAALLGGANILDASFVLPCSETLSASCNIPLSINPAHLQLPAHAYSSTLIGICYLLLPLAGLLYSARHRLQTLLIMSAVAAAVALESVFSVLLSYISEHHLSVRASGSSQELQMIVLGLWFVALAWNLEHPSFKLWLKVSRRST